MVLFTVAMMAIAATAPDAEVEKKLPVVKEIQQEIQAVEEADELVLNDEVEVNEEE